MRWWSAAVLVVGLAACNSSDSSPSSTTDEASIAAPTAAPTTIASTSGVTATTVAPPAAPTTIASTTAAPATTLAPSAVAEQEILARLDAFDADVDSCLADAQNCDQPALLDEFVAVDDTAIRTFLNNAWNYFVSSDLVSVNQGRIERSIASVQASDDGLTGSTHQCVISRAFDSPVPQATVAPTTVPPDLKPVYAQYFYEWAKQPDGRWLIAHSEWTFGFAANNMSEGDAPSLSTEDLAKCFK